jgi:Pyruvate/2-oxoacid:ferredoxin oxidoreductase delta subunit
MPDSPYIVYCRCAFSKEVPAEVKDDVLAALADSDVAFQAVPDLCELAARRDPALARWAAREDLRVVACHSRAVQWLFHAGGAELTDAEHQVLDMRTQSADQIVASLLGPGGSPAIGMAGHQEPSVSVPTPPDAALKVILYEGPGTGPMEGPQRREVLSALLDAGYAVSRAKCPCGIEPDGSPVAILACFQTPPPPMADGQGGAGVRVTVRDVSGRSATETLAMVEEVRQSFGLPAPGGWTPWFPVIDYGRCAACRPCAGFCIFGVYRVDGDGRVAVANPDHCKTNCPACARMCPKVAIIFPKYASAPIDGSPVEAAGVRSEQAGTDLKQALQGDVYAVLRNRGAGGGGEAPQGRADLAAAAAKAGIPARVLMSLNVVNPPSAPAPCACGCDCGGTNCDGDGACDCDDDCACHPEGREP